MAAAAEPESGECKGGEFDEVFAQVNERAILNLRESPCLAGHEEDFEAARVTGEFVAAQGPRQVGVRLKAGGEDDGVFDGEACSLAKVGADGVSGVAEDGDAPDDPGQGGEAVLNFGVD